jgi:hypothetical protein
LQHFPAIEFDCHRGLPSASPCKGKAEVHTIL